MTDQTTDRCVCGDPIELLDAADPTSWIHSPGSDTPCLDAHRVRPPAPMPPADQTPLRDRIRRAICETEGFAFDDDGLEPDEYGEVADAVLALLPAPGVEVAQAVTRAIHAKTPPRDRSDDYRLGWEEALDAAIDTVRAVLPAPVDRAAALREAIALLDQRASSIDAFSSSDFGEEARAVRELTDVANELRRVADETAATETQAATLTPAERTMLDYALNVAQLRMWDTGKYTAEDQAALVSLRRLTAGQPAAGAQGETAATETPEWARPESEEEKLAKCRRMAKALSALPVAPPEWETTTEWPGRHKRPGDRRVHATARFVVNDTQQFWTACGEHVGRGGTPMSHMPVDCRGCKRATATGARQDGAQR